MSFAHLSHTSKSFVVDLDSISIPKYLSDALSHGGSRQEMEENMMAPEKWNLEFYFPPCKEASYSLQVGLYYQDEP